MPRSRQVHATATAEVTPAHWPELPDDAPLWQPPSTAFAADVVRRLDDEHRG